MHASYNQNKLMHNVQFKQLSGNILRIKTLRSKFYCTPGTLYKSTGWNTRQTTSLAFLFVFIYCAPNISSFSQRSFLGQRFARKSWVERWATGHSRALSFNFSYTLWEPDLSFRHYSHLPTSKVHELKLHTEIFGPRTTT